ncbi:MAG: hypothetical protein OEQ29_03475 [Alphaproteobacteria bacterium]|nr:hypothetical protein [Alphaproteobacteria bacterium]
MNELVIEAARTGSLGDPPAGTRSAALYRATRRPDGLSRRATFGGGQLNQPFRA